MEKLDIPFEKLKEADVMAQPAPDTESKEIETKIKQLRKPSTFSMKLNTEELAICERAAQQLGSSWRLWLDAEVRKQLFTSVVATPRITMPSNGQRVMGPSNLERLNDR